MSTNPIVVDLSHWQTDPDWNALKAGGTLGVIHKATEGTSYVDPTYGYRENQARAAGLWWASYHFLKHDDIGDQMQWYIAKVQPRKGSRMVIDFEDPDCTFDDLELAVEYLLGKGYEVTVYGSNHLIDTVDGEYSDILGKTSLWQARYSSSEPEVPDIWPYWSLWQYSDACDATGCGETVDGNRWNGDVEGLAAWFGESTPAPSAVPRVRFDITVSMSAPVELQLFINGEEIVTSAAALPLDP